MIRMRTRVTAAALLATLAAGCTTSGNYVDPRERAAIPLRCPAAQVPICESRGGREPDCRCVSDQDIARSVNW